MSAQAPTIESAAREFVRLDSEVFAHNSPDTDGYKCEECRRRRARDVAHKLLVRLCKEQPTKGPADPLLLEVLAALVEWNLASRAADRWYRKSFPAALDTISPKKREMWELSEKRIAGRLVKAERALVRLREKLGREVRRG